MEANFQCLRCGKRIPVRPEMVGQVVLCPGCLERVYVSEARQATAEAMPVSVDSADLSRPAAATTGTRMRNEATSRALPIGMIASVGGVAAIVLIGGFVMLRSKPDHVGGQQAAKPAEALPPPPPLTVADAQPPEPDQAQTPPVAETTGRPASSARPQPAVEQSPANPAAPKAAATAATPETSKVESKRPVGVLGALGSAGAKTQPTQPQPNQPQATQPQPTQPQPIRSQANQPRAPQPEPVSPSWAEVWRLPAVMSSAPAPLASIGDAETAWKIAVKSASAGVRVEPEPSSAQPAWSLSYLSSSPAAAGKEAVAVLRRDGPDLLFSWAMPLASPEARRELANCVVEISAGAAKRAGQLREPLRREPIALDLTAEKQIVELQIADPPPVNALRLELIEPLSGFSCEATLRAGSNTVMAPGPQPTAALSMGPRPTAPLSMGVIEFAEIPGLEIRIRFVRAEASGNLAFSIEPVFRENQKEFDLRSAKRLDNLEAEAQKPYLIAKQKLPTAEAKLSRSTSDEEKHKANQPLENDRKRFPGWQKRQQELAKSIATLDQDVKFLTQTINTHQARLDAVAKIRSFTKDSDKKAKIAFIMYSECGQPDVLLVDGRGQQ